VAAAFIGTAFARNDREAARTQWFRRRSAASESAHVPDLLLPPFDNIEGHRPRPLGPPDLRGWGIALAAILIFRAVVTLLDHRHMRAQRRWFC
jgi:hypothetical protein